MSYASFLLHAGLVIPDLIRDPASIVALKSWTPDQVQGDEAEVAQ